MSLLRFILPFLFIACSSFESSRNIASSSSLPARIIKIIGPEKTSYETDEDLQLDLKLQAYVYGKRPAIDREIKFEKVKGKFSLESISKKTDNKGQALAQIKVFKDSNQIHLKVRIDNIIKNLHFKISPKTIKPTEVIKKKKELEIPERFIKVKKQDDGNFLVEFAIKQVQGPFLKDLKNEKVLPILKGEGTYSKINYNKKTHRFNYIFYPPEKNGRTQFGFKINKKNIWFKRAIDYQFQKIEAQNISWKFNEKDILPTGFDYFRLEVEIRDSNSNLINVKSPKQFPEIEIIKGGKVIDFKQIKPGIFSGKIQPSLAQRQLEVYLRYQGKIIKEKKIDLSFKYKKDKLSSKDYVPASGVYSENIDYQVIDRQGWEDVTGQLIGFKIINKGINDIVPNGCAADADSNRCQSSREYEFEFIEQARQNTVFTVTDLPVDTLSRMMHGHFYFFPRKVVPHIKMSEDNEKIIMTLPTEEKVYFDAKTRKIIGGVLEEGPIDLGPSRHRRKFPLVRYKGSGVVLRINARGQDARLGQWNNQKISGDYGDTGAKGVLIYKYDKNTDSIKTCYGKKSQFWPQEDISPIPFKFPRDEQFRKYLKDNCSFEF